MVNLTRLGASATGNQNVINNLPINYCTLCVLGDVIFNFAGIVTINDFWGWLNSFQHRWWHSSMGACIISRGC